MERAQVLGRLKEKHELPESVSASDDVKKIILWLCERDPSRWPNAKELLVGSISDVPCHKASKSLRQIIWKRY